MTGRLYFTCVDTSSRPRRPCPTSSTPPERVGRVPRLRTSVVHRTYRVVRTRHIYSQRTFDLPYGLTPTLTPGARLWFLPERSGYKGLRGPSESEDLPGTPRETRQGPVPRSGGRGRRSLRPPRVRPSSPVAGLSVFGLRVRVSPRPPALGLRRRPPHRPVHLAPLMHPVLDRWGPLTPRRPQEDEVRRVGGPSA